MRLLLDRLLGLITLRHDYLRVYFYYAEMHGSVKFTELVQLQPDHKLLDETGLFKKVALTLAELFV